MSDFAYDREEAEEHGLPTEDCPETEMDSGTGKDGLPWSEERSFHYRECPRCGWFSLAVEDTWKEHGDIRRKSHSEFCGRCDHMGYQSIGLPY